MATSYPAHLDALRKAKPAVVRIHTVDGETKDVRVPDRRNKWGAVAKIIEAHSWVRLEGIALDKQKRESIVAIVDNDGAPTDLEDISPKGELVATMTNIMLRAQDIALQRQAQAFGLVLPELRQVAQTVVAALNAMMEVQRNAMELWQRATMVSGGNASASEQLLESMMPAISKRLTDGLTSGGKGKAPAQPKNGAPATTSEG